MKDSDFLKEHAKYLRMGTEELFLIADHIDQIANYLEKLEEIILILIVAFPNLMLNLSQISSNKDANPDHVQ